MQEEENPVHRSSDMGTPEHVMKTVILSEVKVTGDFVRRRRVLIQLPLDYYRNLKNGGITQRQWEAGERLYEDFKRAALYPSPRPISEKISLPPVGSKWPGEASPAAYDSFRRAQALLGPIGAPIVVNVACYGYLLRDFIMPPYTDVRQLMPRLIEGLNILADYYNIPHYPEADKSSPPRNKKPTKEKS